MQIINGAQTVGAIYKAFINNPKAVSEAQVLIRLIQVPVDKHQIAKRITQYTNTQNTIESKDFVSLDSLQKDLKDSLSVANIEYSYMAGEEIKDLKSGFRFEEAAVALACHSKDVSLAVIAKRNVGGLWGNINETPYTSIFNKQLDPFHVWEIVQTYRQINSALKDLDKNYHDRRKQIYTHGNRLITHLVFQIKAGNKFSEDQVKTAVKLATDKIINYTISTYDGYAQTIFKNSLKSQDIVSNVLPECKKQFYGQL